MDKVMSVSLSEAKRRLGQLLQEIYASGGQYLIVTDNQVKGVLLSVDTYNALVERLEDLSDAAELLEAKLSNEPMMPFEEFKEDLHDLAVVAERQDEGVVTFEALKRGLKEDGVLS